MATGTVNEIADATGFYGNAFWVSTAICGFSWLCNFAYVQLLRRVGEPDTVEKVRARLRQKSMFNPAILMRFPLSFWIVIALSLAFGIAWGPFTHITTYVAREQAGAGARGRAGVRACRLTRWGRLSGRLGVWASGRLGVWACTGSWSSSALARTRLWPRGRRRSPWPSPSSSARSSA